MSFGASVEMFSKKMLAATNKEALRVADELFREVVKRTPIGLSDTRGRLINNWHVAQGIGAVNMAFTTSFNISGINSLNQIATLRTAKEFEGRDGEVSLTNTTYYGFRAEYAGWPAPEWTGTVKPYAMVRNSLLFIAARYK